MKIFTTIFTTIFVFAFSGIILFAQEPITIRVNDLYSNNGQIVVLLFKQGQKFKHTAKPFKTIVFKNITKNKCAFNITNLEKGEYAYILYHDEDSNFKVKTNFIGMPQEGVAASNNSGMPNYSKAKFYYNGTKQVHNIALKYL